MAVFVAVLELAPAAGRVADVTVGESSAFVFVVVVVVVVVNEVRLFVLVLTNEDMLVI